MPEGQGKLISDVKTSMTSRKIKEGDYKTYIALFDKVFAADKARIEKENLDLYKKYLASAKPSENIKPDFAILVEGDDTIKGHEDRKQTAIFLQAQAAHEGVKAEYKNTTSKSHKRETYENEFNFVTNQNLLKDSGAETNPFVVNRNVVEYSSQLDKLAGSKKGQVITELKKQAKEEDVTFKGLSSETLDAIKARVKELSTSKDEKEAALYKKYKDGKWNFDILLKEDPKLKDCETKNVAALYLYNLQLKTSMHKIKVGEKLVK